MLRNTLAGVVDEGFVIALSEEGQISERMGLILSSFFCEVTT